MSGKVLEKKKIVLIEDNLFLSDIITKKLEYHGAKIIRFSNGLEGLAGIRKEQPDLVLLDIAMPVMNGYEVLQVMYAEKLTEKIPVIVISNSGQPVEIERVKQLGVRDYLVKANFEPTEVLEKVFAVMNIESGAKPAFETNHESQSGDKVVKVMVVEDDPLLRNLLSVKLSKSGCPHMFSSDGSEAFSMISQYQPTVIVLDMMLPGKTGLEILAELKADAALKNIPVVIFSNKSDDADKIKAKELGAEQYYVKAMTDLTEFVTELRSIAQSTQ